MSGRVRLAIDYGGTATQAVVAWPDGRWTPVTVDGSVVLSSAVLVAADASLWTGEQAWRAAVGEPDRFVPAPRRSAEQDIEVDGRRVPAADLVAATLRRVAGQAQALTGGPVEDVRLVVPAGWGPRRRTWMRHAAHRAGLGQARLVEAPVAVADHLLAGGAQLPVGAYLLVVDVGGGAEVTVLRRGPAGFEVLATLADPAAGGDAIDHALAAALPGEDGGWGWVASVRTAKENLAWHTAITVPQPGGTAVVATAVLLEEAARPVLERVGQLTVDTIVAAELTPADLAGVCLVGGTTRLPLAAAVVARRTGLTPHVVDDPVFAAARGAADATATADDGGGAGEEPVLPPARRAWSVAAPGFLSLAMIVQMLLTVYRGGIYPNSWAEPSWGQLSMASVFAVIACLSAGTLLGSLAATHAAPAGHAAPTGRAPAVSLGILSAVSLGTAIAALYAVVAAQYLQMQIGPFLRWALLPVTPVACLALVAAVVAARQWRTPPGGWSALLTFPTASVIAAGTGMALVQYSATALRWPDMILFIDITGRVGGLLVGVGTITALIRPWMLRLVMGAPLAVITAAIASPNTIGILAGIYATAVTAWWLYRLWTRLVRTPAPHAPQP
ncbi:Hsp70 family protein [Micromonospora sp. WMMA1923]|uniref:Hsp70 family protein n=1 Tax=Micromonospora sp. WMMA1923 TaxID=3404125 RepID=UPI003B94EDB6